MASSTAATTPLAARLFDGAVLSSGLLLFLVAAIRLPREGWSASWYDLLTIPLVVVLARFPLLLDRGDGGIEIGFDSSVLVFLVSTLPPEEAFVIWSLGVVATQLTNDKRPAAKRFNVGVGLIGGAVAVVLIAALRGDEVGTPRELLAVGLGAAGYFATDFLLSGIAVGLEERSPIRRQLVQPGTALAVTCFVPFDSLGYLGAVVVRTAPWWTIVLLAVPLVTLLVATQALTRGREHARRLKVLFDAAVRTATLPGPEHVADALLHDAARLLRLSDVALRDTEPGPDEIGALLRDGEHVRWIVAPARDRARSTVDADQQALEAMAAVASDAFARLRLTDEMTHLARHDVLTGLPNRGLLRDRVEQALRGSRRKGRRLALLFCDLDGFKQVNDRFGHAAGDAVLVDVAKRLVACVREGDTVARLGGDEFAILLEDVRPAQADAACQRILRAMRTGTVVDGHRLPLSTSIGVAMQEPDTSAEQLLLHADMAMYEAKTLGKNQCVNYRPALGTSRVQRLELVESLRAAITGRQLRLAYQPLVRLDTGEIVGVEALARWSPGGVAVPPDVFVNVAEECGLVVALGDLVLDLAAADAHRLVAAAGGPLTLSVNVSAQQLRTQAFGTKIEQTVPRLGEADLVLEITERDFVTDDPAGLATMRRLVDQGVRFALDDFGVGYSSIGYLQNMPISFIKADASFSAEIDHDERSCGLLRSIMTMGQALDIGVVVEGLERPSQVEHLREHVGAILGQGYLLHPPMPLTELVEVLRRNRGSLSPLSTGGTAHRRAAADWA